MNDNKRIDVSFILERAFHHVFVVFVLIVAGFCGWFVYMNVQPSTVEMPEAAQNIENKGQAKPLPDFIVDEIPSDELEQLKP